MTHRDWPTLDGFSQSALAVKTPFLDSKVLDASVTCPILRIELTQTKGHDMLSLQYSKVNQAWLFISGTDVLKVSTTLEGMADHLKTETSLKPEAIAKLLDGALGVAS